jgi:hypothetical protein
MLARSAPLPSGSGWCFELKWDGFRAIVSTEDGLRVRSRRGWNMTPVLPELRKLPTGLVLDGELVAWRGREPYFPLVCRRVLNRRLRAAHAHRLRPAEHEPAQRSSRSSRRCDSFLFHDPTISAHGRFPHLPTRLGQFDRTSPEE